MQYIFRNRMDRIIRMDAGIISCADLYYMGGNRVLKRDPKPAVTSV